MQWSYLVLILDVAAPVTGYMFGKGVYFADVRPRVFALLWARLTQIDPAWLDDVQSEHMFRTPYVALN